MEPTATSGFIGTCVESPATEIQDFDRVVHQRWDDAGDARAINERSVDGTPVVATPDDAQMNSNDAALPLEVRPVTAPVNPGPRGGARGGGNVQQ